MLNWWPFGGGGIADKLNPTKRVKLHGITFTIRKLNPLDYLTGAKALHKIHGTYENAKAGSPLDLDEKDVAKVKNHYRDTFMAGVVSVRCARKELEPTRKSREEIPPGAALLPVDHLMTDWGLAEALYVEIVAFTYGKKKLQAILSQSKNLSSST